MPSRKQVAWCDRCNMSLPVSEFYQVCLKRNQRACKMCYDQFKAKRFSYDEKHKPPEYYKRLISRIRINYLTENGMRGCRDTLNIDAIKNVLMVWGNRSIFSGSSRNISFARWNLSKEAGIEPENLIPFTRLEMSRRMHKKIREFPELVLIVDQRVAANAIEIKRLNSLLPDHTNQAN